MAYYGSRRSSTNISGGVTDVDCQKQVRSWRLLRCLVETLIPCCYGAGFINDERDRTAKQPYLYPQPSTTSTIITGTIFGSRRGKVSLCIQTNKNPTTLLLLLELAVSTQILAREMRGGFLRIALETSRTSYNSSSSDNDDDDDGLLSMPFWKMYCNGRRVGYAVKRRPTETDSEALRLMGSAGVIRGKDLIKGRRDDDDEIMYLRAKFERVCGSANSESFHLIDPDRCIGQELSVFFYRST